MFKEVDENDDDDDKVVWKGDGEKAADADRRANKTSTTRIMVVIMVYLMRSELSAWHPIILKRFHDVLFPSWFPTEQKSEGRNLGDEQRSVL
jgi:hypothetical protein